MEDRATAPRAGVGQSAPHCAAASVPWEGTDRHLPGTARRLGLVHDSHHPRSQQKVPDSPRVLGTRVGPHRACCPVDCPPHVAKPRRRQPVVVATREPSGLSASGWSIFSQSMWMQSLQRQSRSTFGADGDAHGGGTSGHEPPLGEIVPVYDWVGIGVNQALTGLDHPSVIRQVLRGPQDGTRPWAWQSCYGRLPPPLQNSKLSFLRHPCATETMYVRRETAQTH